MQKNYDHLFKIVIVGDSGVGKSCVLMRFADDEFTENFLSTIGVDFRFRTMFIHGLHIKLQIWDTAGQERFKTITSAYYRGADALIITYDITSKETFDHVNNWILEARRFIDDDMPIMILGNKCDRTDREITTEQLSDFATDRNLLFAECSAKNATNIDKIFIDLSKKLIDNKKHIDTVFVNVNDRDRPILLKIKHDSSKCSKC